MNPVSPDCLLNGQFPLMAHLVSTLSLYSSPTRSLFISLSSWTLFFFSFLFFNSFFCGVNRSLRLSHCHSFFFFFQTFYWYILFELENYLFNHPLSFISLYQISLVLRYPIVNMIAVCEWFDSFRAWLSCSLNRPIAPCLVVIVMKKWTMRLICIFFV